MFEFNDGFCFPQLVTGCQFVRSLVKVLCHLELGFVSEADLERGEEIESLSARHELAKA